MAKKPRSTKRIFKSRLLGLFLIMGGPLFPLPPASLSNSTPASKKVIGRAVEDKATTPETEAANSATTTAQKLDEVAAKTTTQNTAETSTKNENTNQQAPVNTPENIPAIAAQDKASTATQQGRVLRVPDDFETLDKAINFARDGDHIIFTGIHNGNIDLKGKKVSLGFKSPPSGDQQQSVAAARPPAQAAPSQAPVQAPAQVNNYYFYQQPYAGYSQPPVTYQPSYVSPPPQQFSYAYPSYYAYPGSSYYASSYYSYPLTYGLGTRYYYPRGYFSDYYDRYPVYNSGSYLTDYCYVKPRCYNNSYYNRCDYYRRNNNCYPNKYSSNNCNGRNYKQNCNDRRGFNRQVQTAPVTRRPPVAVRNIPSGRASVPSRNFSNANVGRRSGGGSARSSNNGGSSASVRGGGLGRAARAL